LSPIKKPSTALMTLQLTAFSFLTAVSLITWEDLSNSHPMRQSTASQPLGSTVRGMAFGWQERQLLQSDIEPEQLQAIPSYNEVMLKHRTLRVRSWETGEITKQDVQKAVRTIQLALIFLDECKYLANNYEWDSLASSIRKPILHSELEEACGILKRANGFLSVEARDEVGFDWGSCAWRHCGAFADAQEALDELESLVGVFEPFECLFCLDVVERSFRDMLAVTKDFQDPNIVMREYESLKRMSDLNEDEVDGTEADYLAALELLRSSDGE